MKTRILQVPRGKDPGQFKSPDSLDTWQVSSDPSVQDTIAPLREAASLLQQSDTPVAFPTETVYGLGADATRSAAVKGIYAAKGRPSDNPLIVHVCDLDMLRRLLRPTGTSSDTTATNGQDQDQDQEDPIPQIYRPLLRRFWPGPLTVLLPNPAGSALAPEVTAGLPTFGARMPASTLARSLIALTGAPLAGPSANASTKPSPTAARHVVDDLDGRLELVLDGGVCGVGVESTVVDGLCDPPVVLRPGGVSMEELRGVEGWQGVVKGYKDASEVGEDGVGPRAPGMKYKHYSPRARVVLFEARTGTQSEEVLRELKMVQGRRDVVGVVRTHRWERLPGREVGAEEGDTDGEADLSYEIHSSVIDGSRVLDIGLGLDSRTVAQGLFSALRELDRKGADVIFIEGIEDKDDIAAAVMNRLRKAASEIRA
ncbi:translation initiation protein Sua5 [Diaporthe helianthi]|uniref:Threonylcarbamoyl-AMP synthase n=1 Tax=Diaporthe helianthi TaxID=158607 RepID=A0A2P5I0L8_DIAHE|nr:translation initiation protein Sua5 [Diaporthe helianthi]